MNKKTSTSQRIKRLRTELEASIETNQQLCANQVNLTDAMNQQNEYITLLEAKIVQQREEIMAHLNDTSDWKAKYIRLSSGE
jgi:hypothetical protein